MASYNNDQMNFYDSGFEQHQDTNYQPYDYNNLQQQHHSFDQAYVQSTYAQSPSIMTPPYVYNHQQSATTDFNNFEDEPPLLEELGINFEHIGLKTKSVLNPLQIPDPNIMDDTDLAGPLVFCLAFGAFLLLSGKVHGFGYIYGVGVMGCLSMYAVLNLMSMTGVTFQCVISVLGYCLLPMVMLSGISVIFALTGSIGTILTGLVILWCSMSASKLFVTVLAMDHQQPLVAYPCALLYGVFALLTVF